MNDNALYEGKLVEVKDNIKELKSINIKTKKLEEIIDEIEKNTKEEIENCYKNNSNSLLINDFINNIYKKNTKKLDEINDSIVRKYEQFYIIFQTFDELDKKDINKDNIISVRDNTIVLLKNMLKTTETIENYNEILESIYKLAYKVLKYELEFLKDSKLLEILKLYPASVSPITKLIKKDIEVLPKKQQEALGNLGKNGFSDINYLDKELILLIIDKKNYKSNEQLKKDIINSFEDYRKLQETFIENNEKVQLKITEIKESKKKKNKLFRKKIIEKSLFVLNTAGIIAAVILSAKLVDKTPDVKRYKTVYTEYDSSKPLEKEEIISYESSKINELEITEYTPWENPGYYRDEYKRNVYTYNISNDVPYSENIENYLNSNFKEYITKTINKSETTKEKPTDNYLENKYVIEQTYQDRTDIKYFENRAGKFLGMLGCALLIASIEWFISLYYNKHKKDYQKESRNIKKALNSQKQMLLEEKNRLNTLNMVLTTMEKNFFEQYEKLPDYLKKDEEILKRVKKLKSNNEEEEEE